MKSGRVFIAGAGPGDKKLISVRAMELVKEADVIVYDRLADKGILRKCKNGCELIYVGKEPNHHISKQEDINSILVNKANEGKNVLRLKGGDPFIFGRGGEEAEELFNNNIRFEVVPGISSFYSACAYAGIPVTHRDFASSIHIMTGHLKTDNDLNYKVIAQMEGTLIFLMGMKNIEKICKGLINNGKSSDTPAAVIQWGTTYKQKCVKGTLNNIYISIRKEKISNPSVIIIGDVVRAEEKINWQRYRPLWGKRVLITRTSEGASEVCSSLYELGADTVEFPTIKIGKSDYIKLDECIKCICDYTWLFFTSENGVESFFERLRFNKVDIRKLYHIKIFCIGERTKSAVEKRGIIIDRVPKIGNSMEAAEEIVEFINNTDKILMPTSELAGDILSNAIQNVGAKCIKAEAYTNTLNMDYDNSVREELINGGFDAIIFASSSQVKNFMEITGGSTGGAKVCSIGPLTSMACIEAKLDVSAEAKTPSVKGLVDTVVEVLSF